MENSIRAVVNQKKLNFEGAKTKSTELKFVTCNINLEYKKDVGKRENKY